MTTKFKKCHGYLSFKNTVSSRSHFCEKYDQSEDRREARSSMMVVITLRWTDYPRGSSSGVRDPCWSGEGQPIDSGDTEQRWAICDRPRRNTGSTKDSKYKDFICD